jgi:hypothetical protein
MESAIPERLKIYFKKDFE